MYAEDANDAPYDSDKDFEKPKDGKAYSNLSSQKITLQKCSNAIHYIEFMFYY